MVADAERAFDHQIARTARIITLVVVAITGILTLLNLSDQYFGFDFYSVLAILAASGVAYWLMRNDFLRLGSGLLAFSSLAVLMAEPFLLLNDPTGLSNYLLSTCIGFVFVAMFACIFVGRAALFLATGLSIADLFVVFLLAGDSGLQSAFLYVAIALLVVAVFVWYVHRLYTSFLARAVEETRATKRKDTLLQASLREKETLLKEVHHRVKNSLQMVSSMLSLQMHELSDREKDRILRDSRDRIEAMALIHERLCHSSDVSRVDMAEYLEGLVSAVFATHRLSSRRVRVETSVDPVVLDLDTAVSAGLMANELLTNAVKHAFPADSEGTITLAMEEPEPGRYRLSVFDDGIGLPSRVRVGKPDSLGLSLVHELARQLRGTVRAESSEGTHVVVEFSAKRVTSPARSGVSPPKRPEKKAPTECTRLIDF